jgi:hypothetical protein
LQKRFSFNVSINMKTRKGGHEDKISRTGFPMARQRRLNANLIQAALNPEVTAYASVHGFQSS